MADSYSGAGGAGNEWELVSLTASTYEAAPGPVLPLLDAHNKTELTPPAAAPSAIFMSQHFNFPLPSDEVITDPPNGESEQQLTPATVDDGAVDTEDPNMPRPEDSVRENGDDDDGLTRYSELNKSSVSSILDDDVLVADALLLHLQGGGGGGGGKSVCSAGEERQAIMLCSSPATPGFRITTDAAGPVDRVRSTSPTHNVPSGLAVNNKVPCEAQAWWNRTFRFLRNNSKESLTFRFIFVAATIVGLAVLGQRDKVQLRLEFNVDTEKISCAVREPLGQVKLNILVGGRPVAQG